MPVIPLEEVKTYIRLSPSVGALADAHVEQSLKLAEEWVARETSSCFINKLHRETYPGNLLYFVPHFGPITEIISIYDATRQRELEEDEFEHVADGDRIYAKTYMHNRVRWPNGYDRYTVSYYGGYTDADGDEPFPEGLKLPIMMLARQIYTEGSVLGMLTDEFYDVLRDYKLQGI